LWDTGHFLSNEVIKEVAKGTRYPIKNSELHIDRDSIPKDMTEAIGYGVLRGNKDIYQYCNDNNIPWWNVDKGYFKHNHYKGYYRVSKNALQPKYIEGAPSNRFDSLHIDIKPWQDNDGHILVCPPTAAMEDFFGMQPGEYCQSIQKKLELLTERPVKVRNKGAGKPLLWDLFNCYCVVTFNSNVAVEALTEGIPAITSKKHVVRSWNDASLSDIGNKDKLMEADRRELFNFLAYNQFTLEEYAKGIAMETVKGIQ